MIRGACHCGAVGLSVATLPKYRNDCQCGHCQKRGALWAYYAPDEVSVVGMTSTYAWGPRHIIFHFCPSCGCTTHWTPADSSGQRMGINTRLLDREAMDGVPIRQSSGPR